MVDAPKLNPPLISTFDYRPELGSIVVSMPDVDSSLFDSVNSELQSATLSITGIAKPRNAPPPSLAIVQEPPKFVITIKSPNLFILAMSALLVMSKKLILEDDDGFKEITPFASNDLRQALLDARLNTHKKWILAKSRMQP